MRWWLGRQGLGAHQILIHNIYETYDNIFQCAITRLNVAQFGSVKPQIKGFEVTWGSI